MVIPMIKERLQERPLTKQEQLFVQYIQNHPHVLFENNAKEIAKLTQVSAPTIIRFTQKLGFQGFNDFQRNYIQEYTLQKEMKNNALDASSSIKDIIQHLPTIYEKIFIETQKLTKQESFVRTINYILQAKQIDFYANDNNYSEVQSACLKLNSLGVRAQSFNALNQDYVFCGQSYGK